MNVRHIAAAALVIVACGACTPQQQLLFSLIPDGTFPTLLSHFERLEDANRRRIADFERRKDWEGLAKFAEENVQSDQTNSDWWLVAGYAYSQLKQRERAIRCYVEVVRLSPDDMFGWNALIEEYRAAGQTERAMQIANRALNVRTDVPETWYLVGEIYSDLRRYEQATNAYGAALKLDEQYPNALLGLGKAYVRLGRKAELQKVEEVLRKIDPAKAGELAAFQAKKP